MSMETTPPASSSLDRTVDSDPASVQEAELADSDPYCPHCGHELVVRRPEDVRAVGEVGTEIATAAEHAAPEKPDGIPARVLTDAQQIEKIYSELSQFGDQLRSIEASARAFAPSERTATALAYTALREYRDDLVGAIAAARCLTASPNLQ